VAAESLEDHAKCTRRHAPIVRRSARFPSSRSRANLFIAGIASRSTDQRDQTAIGSVAAESLEDHAKCTRRHAPIVRRSARFPSSRPRANLFIAGIASRSTDQRDHLAIRWTDSGGLFLLVSGSFTENLSIWELITIIKTMLKWDEKNVT